MSEECDKWTEECDWVIAGDISPQIVSDDEHLNDIFYPTHDADGYPVIAWENSDDPKHICDMHNAWRRLSPATQRLLIERPEAVEACVEAVKEYRYNLIMARFDVGHKQAAINKAIALLPEETT